MSAPAGEGAEMFAQSGDARLYLESAGRGGPVLLVMGLGMSAAAWWRTVPVLAGTCA